MGVIRLATEDDAAPVRDIYAPFCESTPVSFETESPALEEIERRIRKTLERFPWLVCEAGGQVLGFAYAGPHRERAAYRWSVDVTVYVREGQHRLGVGRALYASLARVLELQGYYNAYAGITLPNAASVGLHEAMGFRPVGVYRNVGYKLGAWHDVGWWCRPLRSFEPEPGEPKALPEVRETAGWAAIVAAGLPFLKAHRPG
jgi:L-amino acid N-acyltransferase YncA